MDQIQISILSLGWVLPLCVVETSSKSSWSRSKPKRPSNGPTRQSIGAQPSIIQTLTARSRVAWLAWLSEKAPWPPPSID